MAPVAESFPKQLLLHQFLVENQEPFHLKSFIAHKRSLASAAAASPEKPPQVVVFHVPSDTAAVLLDAAVRIQKQSSSHSGVAYLFTKLWNRSIKRRTRGGDEGKIRETDGISCTPRQSSAGASLNSSVSGCGASPEFVSPTNSPVHPLKQSCPGANSSNEVKEQCSPVSILEPPFLDDDHHGSSDTTEDLEASSDNDAYIDLQRAEQELFRFGGLDPIELEKKFDGNCSDGLGGGKSEPLRIPGRCGNVWKDVDLKEIEMSLDGWGKYEEIVEEIVREIEGAVCGEELLIGELL